MNHAQDGPLFRTRNRQQPRTQAMTPFSSFPNPRMKEKSERKEEQSGESKRKKEKIKQKGKGGTH